MKWEDKLQAIIDYVEEHLQRTQDPIDTKEIGKIAGCSYSFFQKVFSYMNDISFADYIRFRKLTLAGYDLKSKNTKVVDLSFKYGYDSPTSFSKAFQLFHGVSPRDAKKAEVPLNIYPKMKVNHHTRYSWRLESKSALLLVGKGITIVLEGHQPEDEIPRFWDACQSDGSFSKMISLDEGTPQGLFGIFPFYREYSQEMKYYIMVESSQLPPEDFISLELPAVTWAIFNCYGGPMHAIQDGWNYIKEEWLIKYPFKHADCPEIEWYSSGDVGEANYLSQIWIPIIKEI